MSRHAGRHWWHCFKALPVGIHLSLWALVAMATILIIVYNV